MPTSQHLRAFAPAFRLRRSRSNIRTVKFFGAFGLWFAFLPAFAEPAAVEEVESSAPASAKPAPETQRHPITLPQVQRDRSQLLAATIDRPTPVWFDLNHNRRLLAFWQPEKSAAAKGAVIIVAAPGLPYASNPLVQTLQASLPEAGWSTLLIALPEFFGPPPPKRANEKPAPVPAAVPEAPPDDGDIDETQVVFSETEAETDASDNNTDDADDQPSTFIEWQDYLTFTEDVLTRAIAFLHQKEQYNIALLGEGVGGYISLQFNSRAPQTAPSTVEKDNETAAVDRDIRALILVDLQPGFDAGTELLNTPNVPTFDLFSKSRGLVIREAKNRILAARGQEYDLYLQKPIASGSTRVRADSAGKLIRGFLDRHVAGEQM